MSKKKFDPVKHTGAYSKLPCCGPYAVSKVVNRDVSSVLRKMGEGRTKNWKGRSNCSQCLTAIRHFGGRVQKAETGGRLAKWIDQHTTKTGIYFVRTGGHFLAVKNQVIYDQGMTALPQDHNCRNKTVTHAWRVTHEKG